MELLTDYTLWASLLSLTTLEIVLGIDNVVFIALVVQHLHSSQRKQARMIGLTLAMGIRIAMLFGISWVLQLQEPLLPPFFGHAFSGKDLMMLSGGLFLLYKASASMREELTGEEKQQAREFKGGFKKTIAQIVFLDLIFSFDSVMTAVGMTTNVQVIIAAMLIAMAVMLAASGYIGDFIERNPTIKMLALSFILMIGVLLVGEGLGLHVPRGYIYFGMAFSFGVEILNMLARKKKAKSSRN
jgi:predicted tellurium resistance membrane protein TerC